MEIFLFWIVLAIAVGAYASSKGRSGVGFFFLSLLLSPLIGFIWVAVSGSNPAGKGLRKCPQCAEWIQPEALKCRFCSTDLSAPVAPALAPSLPPIVHKESAEPSLKWLAVVAGIALFSLIVFWSVQYSSVQGAKATEDSAIASMRSVATACIVYDSSFTHGFPEKLAFLGPPSAGSADELGAGFIDAALASGSKAGYVFEYRPGRRVRGKIASFTLLARPGSKGRSFFVDQTNVIRYSAIGDADKSSLPL